MTPTPQPSRLTDTEKDALILAQAEIIAKVMAGFAGLEAKLGDPPKTPNNSSTPPSKGRKPTGRKRPGG